METIDILEKKLDLAPPKMYAVRIINDDTTPFEFVIAILCQVFNHDTQTASALMLTAHTNGSAVVYCGPKDIAETKVEVAQMNSHAYNFELRFQIEED